MQWSQARSFFESREAETLEHLKRLVAVNSFTGNRDGVLQNAALVEDLFQPLGFEARRVASEVPGFGEHLLLHRSGKKRVVLVSHLDTVFAPEESFPWREAGPRIYGPGVNDIKGGTVLIHLFLQGLQKFAPDVFDGVDWTLVLDASEERGSRGFIDVLRAAVQGATACLVYEPGYPTSDGVHGTVVVSRKGSARFCLRVRGRAAHSGSHHDHGASAIVELADKIVRVAGLTDYGRGITTNIGKVSGGTVVNTVPAYAEALLDLRARDPESFEETKRKIREICREATVRSPADGFACTLELEEHPDYPPMPRNPGTERLFALARSCAQELGDPVEPQDRGGASDACHVWDLVPTIDGLGPIGDSAHCLNEEFVLRDSFVRRALLNCALISRLA
jgi:glutamate carboxypeptidase